MPRTEGIFRFCVSLAAKLALLCLASMDIVWGQTPVASFSPTSLTFGSQQIGTTSAVQIVSLTNTGTAPLSVLGISITGTDRPDFAPQTNNCPSTLNVNVSCNINVKFTPSALGTRTASITVKDNAANSPQLIPLTGTGTGLPPVASLSPTSLNFGTQPVGTPTAPQVVTLTNTGGSPLTISGISITGTNRAAFAPQTNNCPSALNVNASCQVNVKFTPQATGTLTASITFKDNAGDSPQNVSLTGTGSGAAPVASLSPTSLNFGSQPIGVSTAAQTVILTNTGGSPLSINGISISGTNQSNFAPESNNCPGSLSVNASCQVSVKFTPSGLGTRTGSIIFTNNASDSPQTVPLSGTGSGTAPVVSLSPTSLNFGNQQIATSSPVQTVTLTNAGGSPLGINGISISGANIPDFAPQMNNCPLNVNANASCQINVKFTPSAAGPRTASIVFKDTAADSPQTVPLSGTGFGTPNAVLSPTSLSFGNQAVGITSTSQTVTLTNSGNAPLNIVSIQAGGDYGQANTCSGVLSAGANCAINVTFTPTATGTRQSSIRFTDNAGNSPQFVTVTGRGTGTSAINLSQPSLSFGNQTVGTASGPQSITLSNTGTGSIDIVNIIASGDYAQTNNCPATLGPSANCTISVVFTPSGAGTRSGYVTINDTDIAALQTVGLSGSGIAPITTVSITPRVASLTFTQTQQFQATISGAASSAVGWSVDGIAGGGPGVGTISASGLYTPPTSAGTHSIGATSNADPTQTATVPVTVQGYPGTFTYQNDTSRTGQNLSETVLTTGNVNQTQFGKLFSYPVDGMVYAQPLYVANVSIPGAGFHNVVYVATQHDSVYAFDADGLSTSPLWQVTFINAAGGVTTLGNADVGCTDMNGEIGITGTPVIDPAAGLLYVLARTKEVSGSTTTYVQRLHALNIATGAEAANSPVVIQASVAGSGAGNTNGNLPFDPLYDNQRPGLLLLNGVVYIAWGALCDVGTYHGWILGYNGATLQQVAVYNDTPNGSEGGIWQGGGALAADQDGNIFFESGNGTFDANVGGTDYGDSVVKLNSNQALATADFFTPYDQSNLNLNNIDLGSSGPILFPDQSIGPVHLLVGGGKEGTIYLLNRDQLGYFNSAGDTQIVQSLLNALPSGMRAPLGYWASQIYIQANKDVLKVFRLHNGLLSQMPVSTQSYVYAYPGGVPAISAMGAANGIVWLVEYQSTSPAVLHAYDAANVSREIWNSSQAGTRDQAGPAVKFVAPTVGNAKVYLGTATELDVYGLWP